MFLKTFIIVIISIIVIKKNINILDITNFFIRSPQTYDKIVDVITKSKYKKISRNNIPKNLKNKIIIKKLKIKNYSKENVINKITQNLRKTRFKSNNITVVDYLDFYSKYYFSPHTDIEWRAFMNTGYQVWFLRENKNKNNHGNMFILDNKYINKKYAKKPYALNLIGGKVYIFKNNYDQSKVSIIKKIVGSNKIYKKNLMEVKSLKWFLKNTKIYYLDIKEGEYIAFDKNICHMSDIRGERRHAINFRVLNGKKKEKKKHDGYLKYNDSFYIN